MLARTSVVFVLMAVACALVPGSATAQRLEIDPNTSSITVHVYKSGLFSAFGDNHEVQAPISEGYADERAHRVEFAIPTQRMRVLDPQLSTSKRKEVQHRMLGPDVLDVSRYPQITFESTDIEQSGQGRFVVHGKLRLHGVTRPVVVHVQAENGRYVGSSTLKQRDFGITPVSVGGGTVKVKDELKIEFDIRIRRQTANANSRR